MTPEVDQIKADLQRCKKIPDVNACYNHHHPTLARLWKEGDDMKTMCIQIKNLRDYQIKGIKEGWIK